MNHCYSYQSDAHKNVLCVVNKQITGDRSVFLTHPCRKQPLKVCFISNDHGRILFEAFDWLFICDDPSDIHNLRVKVVVEINTL